MYKFSRKIALMLIIAMIFSFMPVMEIPVFAEETQSDNKDKFGITMTPPSDFDENDGKNPYGKGKFNLNPISELHVMKSYHESKNDSHQSSIWYDSIELGKSPMNGISHTCYEHPTQHYVDMLNHVAFDPHGTGKDDHVACIGMQVTDPKNKRIGKDNDSLVLYAANLTNGNNIINPTRYDSGNHDYFSAVNKQWEAANILAITAGDYDGDGKDTVVFYEAGRDSRKIHEEGVNGNQWSWGGTVVNLNALLLNATSYFDSGDKDLVKRSMTLVQMVSGDVDRDGKDELIVLAGWGNIKDNDNSKKWVDRASHIFIFKKIDNSWQKIFSQKLQYDDGTNNIMMRYAGVAIGDINGDNMPEIVIGGYKTVVNKGATEWPHGNNDVEKDKFLIKVIRYNTKTKTFDYEDDAFLEVNSNELIKNGMYTDKNMAMQSPVSIECVALNGYGQPKDVFLEGTIYKGTYLTGTEGNYPYTPHTKAVNGIGGAIINNVYIEDVVVGNFDGNTYGREQVMYSTVYHHQSTTRYYFRLNSIGLKPDPSDSNMRIFYHASDDNIGMNNRTMDENMYVSIAAVDADDDGTIGYYESKEFVYTDPDVMAILQSSPYFKELDSLDSGYSSSGSTSFGTAKGSEIGSGGCTTATAGVYVAVEIGKDLGPKFEAEASATFDWAKEYEEAKSVEYSIEFTGDSGDDYVVMYRTPVILYHYKVYDPSVRQYKPMVVGISGEPVNSIITVEEYNEMVDRDPEYEPIGESILPSTPGEPGTYYRDKNSLKNFTGFGQTNSLSTGQSSIGQSFTAGSSSSVSQSYQVGWELKLGGGWAWPAANVTAGVTVGHGKGWTKSEVNYETVTKTGSVYNRPEGADQYNFNWEFGTWTVELNEKEIPMLGYIIYDYSAPPSIPEIEVTDITDNSVKLEWSPVTRPAEEYLIYLYNETAPLGMEYTLVGKVDGSKREFIHTGLNENTIYQYSLVAKEGNMSSAYSTLVTVSTTSMGYSPVIVKNPSNVSVSAGDTAVFSINALPSAGAGYGISYQWQEKDGVKWNPIQGSNSSKLTLYNVTKDMDGNKYRCIVSQWHDGVFAYTYSDAAELIVGKAESTVNLNIYNSLGTAINTGNANYVVSKNSEVDVEVPRKINVTIGEVTEEYTEYKEIGKTDNYIYLGNDGYYQFYNLSVSDIDGYTADYKTKLTVPDKYFSTTDPSSDDPSSGKIDFDYYTMQSGKPLIKTVKAGDNEINYIVYTAQKTDNSTVDPVYRDSEDRYYSSVDGDPVEFIEEGYTYKIKLTTDEADEIITTETIVDKEYDIFTDNDGNVIYGLNDDVDEIYNYYKLNSELTPIYLIVPYLFDGTDINSNNLTQVMVYGTETVTNYVTKSGDEVTIKAHIGNGSTGKIISGTVIFQIINNKTASGTSIISDLNADGIAIIKWIPSSTGNYTITAIYNGSESLKGSSSSTGFYAVDPNTPSSFYLLDAQDAVYGDIVTINILKATRTGENTTTEVIEGSGISAAYKVTNTEGDTTDLSSNEFRAEEPGTYLLTAEIGSENKIIITKIVVVFKRPITVTAPTGKYPVTEADKTIGNLTVSYTGNPEKEGLVQGDSLNNAINVECSMTNNSGTGQYPVLLRFTASSDDLLKKYIVTLVNGIYTVTGDSYLVLFSSGSNGRLRGLEGDNKIEMTSGNLVSSGRELTFVAMPDEGFTVDYWELNGEKLIGYMADTYVVDSLNGQINISVYFKPVTSSINFSAGLNGSITAKFADGAGQEVLSPVNLDENKSLYLTAVPDEGYVVKQWTLTRNNKSVVQKYDDGKTVYSEEDFILEDMSIPASIIVEFEQEKLLKISTAVVNDDGTPAVGSSVTVGGNKYSPSTGQAINGSTVNFEVIKGDGAMVKEWRLYEGDTFTLLQGNIDTLTIRNLQKDYDIRVVMTNAQYYPVHFEAQDESGNEVTTALVSAMWVKGKDEVQLNNGGSYPGFITIDFETTIPDDYEFVGWKIKFGNEDFTNIPGTDLSYHLDNFNQETTVIVELSKKLLISFEGDSHSDIEAYYEFNGDDGYVNDGSYVCKGTDITFTASPDKGYEIDYWLINGEKLHGIPVENSDDQTFTIENIINDITIRVECKEIPEYDIYYSVFDTNGPEEDGGLNGSVSINVERKGMRSYKGSKEAASEGSITAYRDSTVTLNARADEGYRVQYWKVDGSIVRENGINIKSSSYTFSNLEDDHTVSVQFEKIGTDSTYGYIGDTGSGTITGTVEGLPVDESFILLEDATVVLTASPSSGYKIDKWTENGNDVAESTDTYSYTSIDGLGVDIRVHFVQVDYEIKFGADKYGSVTAAVNGSSTGASPSQIRGGTEITFTAAPNQGYTLDRWEVDGVIAAGETENEFIWTVPNAYPQKSFTIKAYFKSGTYYVSYEAGDNGTVSATLYGNIFDSGSTAAGNQKIIFTAEPDEGYVVDKWLVNDIEVTGASGNVYNHIVRGNETVKVEFTKMGYPITFSANTGGTLTAESDGKNISSGTPVSGEESVKFTASANEGYYIKAWYVDNVKVMDEEVPFTGVSYDILSVTKAVNVEVEYGINSYTVNFRLGTESEAMGSITAKVDVAQVVDGGMVDYGKTIVFTVTPQTGYIVKSRNIDGIITGSETNPLEENTYTHIVKGNVTVEVDLMAIPYYEVTFTKEGKGTVTSSLEGTNSSSVVRHGSITFTAAPGPYYMFKEWQIDGIKQDGKSNVITISDIKKNMAVKAVFAEAVSYKVSMKVEGDGGTISAKDDGVTITHEPDGYVPVAGDSEVVFTAAPSSENMVKEWRINTVIQQALGNTLTIPELKNDVIVSVSFEPIKLHNITINETTDGSINITSYIPEDYRTGKSIRDRGSIIFTVTPDAGYIITKTTVNSSEVGATSENNGTKTYTVDNITREINISAEFEKTPYKVTFAQQKGGRLTAKLEDGTPVSNGDSLPAGSKVIFSISLENNYEVVKWKVNGADVVDTSAKLNVALLEDTNVAVVLKYTGGGGTGGGPSGGGGDDVVEDKLIKEGDFIIEGNKLTVNLTDGNNKLSKEAAEKLIGLNRRYLINLTGNRQNILLPVNTLNDGDDPNNMILDTSVLSGNPGQVIAHVDEDGNITIVTFSSVNNKLASYMPLGNIHGGKYIIMDNYKIFNDIIGHWGESYINFVTSHNIFMGSDGFGFDPDSYMTRAMVVTVIGRMVNADISQIQSSSFSDIDINTWYGAYVEWASQNNIVKGIGDYKFAPDEPINRQQLATIIYNFIISEKLTLNLIDLSEIRAFTDENNISNWAIDAIKYIQGAEIIRGRDNNSFDPESTATRTEVAAVIQRLIENILR